ncbi:hypothetical protein RB195_021695 [Necator americanus]|uniref:Uncharacterized protein n=1 Tax=Necator americanus TaxID=51031 RepID=A0ABR1ECH7_NECAM
MLKCPAAFREYNSIVVSLAVDEEAPRWCQDKRPRGRPKIRWLDRVKLDMIDARLCTADAMDRTKWKTRSRKADPATTRDKR